MKKIALFSLVSFLIIFTTPLNIYAHKRAKYNIVIDTDGGIDDFRAMSLFMASKEFNINAITCVDGVLEPFQSAFYIKQIIQKYHHDGILIGKGKQYKTSDKYRNHALQYWERTFGKAQDSNFFNAVELLNFSLINNKKPTIIIALGPLSNIYELLKKYPETNQKIEMILWYANYDNMNISGFNYDENKQAFDFLIKNHLPLKIISSQEFKYNNDFIEQCKEIKSLYANLFISFFDYPESSNEMYYWDETSALYLLYPSIFNEIITPNHLHYITPKPNNYLDVLVTTILNSNKPDIGVVYNEIPTSGQMLNNDINEYALQILEKHGYAEFKIVALTSEIHSHMGIYSILGAKTGLRIMEYLHIGLDEIELISYAGTNPPVSCFNDGLQVGTGSTIGYGTISIDTTKDIKPSVLVKYKGRTIIFSIKEEIISQIKNDIGQIISKYGLETEMYWLKLREISILNYWLGTSRYDLLDIKEITDWKIPKE